MVLRSFVTFVVDRRTERSTDLGIKAPSRSLIQLQFQLKLRAKLERGTAQPQLVFVYC